MRGAEKLLIVRRSIAKGCYFCCCVRRLQSKQVSLPAMLCGFRHTGLKLNAQGITSYRHFHSFSERTEINAFANASWRPAQTIHNALQEKAKLDCSAAAGIRGKSKYASPTLFSCIGGHVTWLGFEGRRWIRFTVYCFFWQITNGGDRGGTVVNLLAPELFF